MSPYTNMGSTRTSDHNCVNLNIHRPSQVALLVKNPPGNAGDPGLIPGSGRSPGEGNGNPLQYA